MQHMNLDSLPILLLHRIFNNLHIQEILTSVCGTCKRLENGLKTYEQYQVSLVEILILIIR